MHKSALAKPGLILYIVVLLLILGTSTVFSAGQNAPTQTGTITLIKSVIIDGGGTALPDDFNLTVGGTPVNSGDPNDFEPGSLVIDETLLADYMFVSITGDAKCPGNLGGSIDLSDGDDVTCTITNRFIPIEINPTTSLTTYENGSSSATFDVRLTTAPAVTTTVTIPLSSSNTDEGAPDQPSLEFNDVNWNDFQEVIVSGVDDDFDDGDTVYTIQIGPVSSGDPIFNGLDPADLDYTNIDDDTFGISVVPTIGILTSESGVFDTFDVVLESKPFSADVTIDLYSSNTLEGTIDQSTLTFLQDQWNIPQTVTVTGVDDPFDDGDIPYTIVLDPAVSGDPDYDGLDPDDVSALNSDNDTAGFTVTPLTGLWTNEGGRADTFKVLLKTKPFNPVDLEFTSTDTSEGVVSTLIDTITPLEWQPDKYFEYQVIGVDDTSSDGDIPYQIDITSESIDTAYDGFAESLDVINYDSPTIEWYRPVGDEEIYVVEDNTPILLEVRKVGNEPISLVHFYRWAESLGTQLIIGEDNTPPYRIWLDPSDLDFDYNQIYSYALGPLPPSGQEVKNFSIHKWILIDRPGPSGPNVFLPLVINP